MSPDYLGEDDFQHTLLNDVLANAVGHQWQAQTAWLQVQNVTPYQGQSQYAYAQYYGQLAPTNYGPTETARLITLDLPGLGYIPSATQASGHGVMFDINSNGFANAMDWVGPRVGILGIKYDGVLDNGKDLLDDTRIDKSALGVRSLEQFATTNSGVLTAADPVFNELVVWTDINQDGIAQDNEARTLAQLGITALNYNSGTFVQNGVSKLLASTDLTADRQGAITQQLNGGLLARGASPPA